MSKLSEFYTIYHAFREAENLADFHASHAKLSMDCENQIFNKNIFL